MRRLTVLAALVAALFCGVAQANDARLDRLASVFAMRPYTIDCRTETDDAYMSFAWGYTHLDWDRAVVNAEACDNVVAMLDGQPFDDFYAMEGVATITHESYHGRRWSDRGDEARVECQAIRHWKVAMRLLGVDEETIARLWPWALADHWELVRLVPVYWWSGCKVPR